MYSQAIQMKLTSSNEVYLQRKLMDLESWLIDKGCKSEIIRQEIRKVTAVDRKSILKKRSK